MTPEEKIRVLNQAKIKLDSMATELLNLSYEVAKNKEEYKMAYRTELLKWRTRGRNEPANVAIGLAEGEETVAELEKNYEISKFKYEYLKEKMKNERLEIEIIRSTLAYDRATYLNQ